MVFAVLAMALSGVPGLFFSRRSMAGQWIATLLNLLSTLLGAAALPAFASDGYHSANMACAWALPWGGFAVGLDTLTVVFLIPILGISLLGSIYGMGYWKQAQHPANGRKLRFCWGLMNAGMMMVVLARDGVLFLMAWEIMALTAFFLITTEDHDPCVREAGWVYLIAAHIGMVALVAMFVLLHWATGSFDLWLTVTTPVARGVAAAIFLLALLGFGLKAGVMPLHVWLPGAHANAPSHVSALFSGVMLNIGIYGLVRTGEILAVPPLWWGLTLLIVGAGSAVAAMIFAVCQNDYKRLLAYSSIENMGIVTIGLGLAMIGRSEHQPALILLGLGGALFHVLNHSLFKPLLFMGAGNVLHATHSRNMDSLGGLAGKMPVTAGLFFIGALAICGLPGLNGFMSEWLIYLGLLRTATEAQTGTFVWISLAAAALAVTGALAVAGFVKLLGSVFLGNKRSADTDHAHDPSAGTLTPMAILALGCVAMALFPNGIARLLVRAAHGWAPHMIHAGDSIEPLAPLHEMAVLNAVLLLTAVAILVVLWIRRKSSTETIPTWSCAYNRPVARMQYTGASFSRMLAQLFAWMIPVKSFLPPGRYFPQPAQWTQDVPDTVLDRGLIPSFARAQRMLARLRPLQNKPVNVYLAYMLAVLLLLLLALQL
jgi:hydrogenase-4 component B